MEMQQGKKKILTFLGWYLDDSFDVISLNAYIFETGKFWYILDF